MAITAYAVLQINQNGQEFMPGDAIVLPDDTDEEQAGIEILVRQGVISLDPPTNIPAGAEEEDEPEEPVDTDDGEPTPAPKAKAKK